MNKFFLICIFLLLNGCATQTYHINPVGDAYVVKEERMQNFFVAGIGQEKAMDAAEICGGAENIIKVESKLSFLDGFLGVLTQGIYTPRTAKVYCKNSTGQ